MTTALRLTIAALGLATFNLSAASVIQFSAERYNVLEGIDHVDLQVQRTDDLSTEVSVDLVTAGVRATAGLDYLDVVTNLTFAAGQTDRIVAVPILNDTLVEGMETFQAETFQATLSNPTGGAVLGTRSNAVGRIQDNDTPWSLESASYWVGESEASVVIALLRTGDADAPGTVEVRTVDGTAQAGLDYIGLTNTLTVAVGDGIKLITVPALNDGLRESNETFQLYLTNATGGVVLGTPASATITIRDNDPGLRFEFGAYPIQENQGFLTVRVLRDNDVDLQRFTVDYATSDLTATAGADYTETTGTLAFAEGELFKTLSIPILNDGFREPEERLLLYLTNATGGVSLAGPAPATIRITDNDPGVRLDFGDYSIRENDGSLAVRVQRGSDANLGAFTVDYATSDLTATAGADYTETTGTLAFAEGELFKTLSIPILNDGLKEPEQRFRLYLTNATAGGSLASPASATIWITDNDPGIGFDSSNYAAREDQGSLALKVERGNDGDLQAFTVEYTTEDGAALAGTDFTETRGTLTFAEGELFKTLVVPILNNGSTEANKEFRLYLTNASAGLSLGSPALATATIIDNDPGVGFRRLVHFIREDEGLLTVEVVRGNDVDLRAFTVDFTTHDGSAFAGMDYAETHGTLAFAEGETSKVVSIPITWNEPVELDRDFRLTLSSPSIGFVLNRGTATANIKILDVTDMEPHCVGNISVLATQGIQLTLGGSLPWRFRDYFDLYPVEVSGNLFDWTPLATLVRTNATLELPTYTEAATSDPAARFYRTAARHCITPLQQPTGPFPVGMISRLVYDPTRQNRYSLPSIAAFMVSVWYPAIGEAGKLPGRMEDEGMTSVRTRWFVSHAFPDTEWASQQAPYPVVVYSPGGWGTRAEFMERGPELASHGYVVVAADPVDAGVTVFPDGALLGGDYSLGVTDAGFQDRVRDLRCVMEELERWNQPNALAAGRLDLTRVATVGFSWGGGVAAEVCRTDPRVQAVVLLDAYLQNAGSIARFGLAKPMLGMYSTGVGGDSTLYNKVVQDAIWMQISDTVHGEFCDYYWHGDYRTNPPQRGREAARTISAYTLWFLNKYLKGSTEPMPALADYPRVIHFKQK